MLRKFTRKRALVVASIAVVAVAAVAFAFWSSTGSGTGSASAVDPANETVSVAQTSTISNLYPGGPAQTLSGTVTNNSSENSVHVGSVSATIASTSNPTDCPASNFELGGSAPVNAQVGPAGPGDADTTTWTGLTIDMVDAAGDGCKGVTVNLSYTSN